MRTLAVLPVKRFERAKRRLEAALEPGSYFVRARQVNSNNEELEAVVRVVVPVAEAAEAKPAR